MRVAFCTLGCKVNQYETEAMREAFEAAGHTAVPFSETADAYIINTCAVTGMSARKSRQMASRAHVLSPGAVIAMVGCYAQLSPAELAGISGVSVVIGSQKKCDIVRLVENAAAGSAATEVEESIPAEYERISTSRGEKTRAYVKIQDGCDNFCSYCIIPYARGRKRSRSLADIAAEIERLCNNGYRETVITGIHLLSYGDDLASGVDITDVIGLAAGFGGVERIRLGSLDPSRMTEGLIAALAGNKKICRQFHLSLQSGSDTVLQRMNRRYTSAEYADVVDRLRDAVPGCAVTTDIIVGFPQETEEEHLETLAFAERIGFSKIHVFQYSRRSGTVADRMSGQVPADVKARRAHELLGLSEKLERSFAASLIGQTVDVLVEEPWGDGGVTGFSDTYVRAYVDGCAETPGGLIRARVYDVFEQGVAAEPEKE